MFPPFPQPQPQIPEGAVIISVAFFVMCAVIAIGFPIARAIARRMDRRRIAGRGLRINRTRCGAAPGEALVQSPTLDRLGGNCR